jgi:predicted nucleic-acid-binding Zn-ribbon protein
MREQPEDDGKGLACLRCGGEMFQCQVNNGGVQSFFLQPLDLGILDQRRAYVGAFVCKNCHYTELSAGDIEQILPRSH